MDAGLAARAAELARDWDESVLKPLRAVRRRLKTPVAGISDSAREASRERLKDEEIAAERLLLDALEAMTPAAGSGAAGRFTLLAGTYNYALDVLRPLAKGVYRFYYKVAGDPVRKSVRFRV